MCMFVLASSGRRRNLSVISTELTFCVFLGWLYPTLGLGSILQNALEHSSRRLSGICPRRLRRHSPTSAFVKFSGQAVAGAIFFCVRVAHPGFAGIVWSSPLPSIISLPLTILWVLAITNAFNLIDGLDGSGCGFGFVFHPGGICGFACSARCPGCPSWRWLWPGPSSGFLRYNFNPATIFLGDCGSLFIGFMLSALALRGAQKAPTTVAVAIPVVSFGLPIVETGVSILRRLIAGRPIFTGDREHIHHKLLEHGLSHRQVVIVLYGVSGSVCVA